MKEQRDSTRMALWWIRRDLRLTDNQALAAALAQADTVIPVFILDSTLLASPYVGPKRLAFLFGGLRRLDADLRQRGSRLILRQGEPIDALTNLITATQASVIYAEEDFTPYARRRDARVEKHLPLRLVGGLTVFPPEAVRKTDGSPYTVFTAFSRTWKGLPPPSAQSIIPAPSYLATPLELAGLPIPQEPILPAIIPFPPGEAEAQCRLREFTQGDAAPIYLYAEKRNILSEEGTSGLSPYLRFGMVSARQVAVAAIRAMSSAPDTTARQGAETWLNEIIWREFYQAILSHFPRVRRQSFRENLRHIRWRNDAAAFAAWCEGRTGYPVVDAAMRQLLQTGWMHNRARMIVASFLVKDLLTDWRWGERWFMQHLVDGDTAANNGGWQWTAGVGTDAAPYFRIFSPIAQGQKFDPEGSYVRRWVPELAAVPADFIHEPWRMPLNIQQASRCVIGVDYPVPIVDHMTARERTLAAYARARGQP